MIVKYTTKGNYEDVSCRMGEITEHNLMDMSYTLRDPTMPSPEINWKIYCNKEELDKFSSEVVSKLIDVPVDLFSISKLFLPSWGYVEFSEEEITPDYESIEEFRKMLKEKYERNEIAFSKLLK